MTEKKLAGRVQLPLFDGAEIGPGIYLIGEPNPVEGTNLLRCLANVYGQLALVELSVKFGMPDTGDAQ